jgi:anti-anti-sigma regulatory factor
MNAPQSTPVSPSAAALPASIGARYRVLAQLGRGGSAYVYQVREIATGRELALKRLRHDVSAARLATLTKHLEREFYALAQLRHPRVIEVYDYGVSDGLPYYTMELLDGGDLRASAPLPWRRACELMYDIASSLALLHSRRFVHRDVTPSNIRCTRDGRAKLIDFGAMVPMGTGATVIGTPAYVAPEVQQRGVLDASTDLFSLGATLYFTVTGRTPFASADLAGMAAAWATTPLAPSQHVPEIPPAFDALVLSLLSIEPAERPRSAFEVMQRLAALAGLPVSESGNVSQGYLFAPHVVGREMALRSVRNHQQRALNDAGSALWIEGESGVGRSRLLELCTLEAQTTGATVLRLAATDGATMFAGAAHLAHTLLAALPDVARAALPVSAELHALLTPTTLESGAAPASRPTLAEAARPALQDALTRWLLALSVEHPIVFAIDDVQRLDEATLAWLAALAHAAPHSRLLLIVTAESEAARESSAALSILKRHSTVSCVLPLTRGESDAMFASIFGAVPNLGLLSERIFTLAAGNPRRSLALAQYLVDQGHVVYAAGAWSLPDALPLETLPVASEALFGARLARLGRLARTLAESQALSAVAALGSEDYRVLAPYAEARSLDDALTELIAHEIVHGDGVHYTLAHGGYATALLAQLEPIALAQRHEALARLAEHRGRHASVIAYHRLNAGQEERALDLLAGATETNISHLRELDHASVRTMLERALVVTQGLGRPKRERFELMRHLITLSVFGDAEIYGRAAPAFRAQLEADAGLLAYWARSEVSDPAERMSAALAEAQVHYAATPAHDRVYRVDEALRWLAMHVATSIGIGMRALDLALLSSLPALLEPFVSLSPLLAAIWENAEASCDAVVRSRSERAVARWQRVHERLEGIEGDPRILTIRNAVAYGIAEVTATLGLSSQALQRSALLDREPLQRVNAMRVRRIVCLQHGDWAGAERAREQAELMGLQASGRQLFEAPLRTELDAHWLARDLAGVKQTADRIGRLVPIYPGWRIHHRLAQGYFDALCGDSASALIAFDDCVALSQPSAHDPDRKCEAWLRASAAALSMLLELGRFEEARARGEAVLAESRSLEISAASHRVARELALAEAKTGHAARAIERIEGVIADQNQRGVSGLQLGASYEARARVAIALNNAADAARYAALAASEFRHGAGGALSSPYGRLLQEARRAGVDLPAHAVEFSASALASLPSDPHAQAVVRWLGDAQGDARARLALELLCKHARSAGGYLYVSRGPNAELTRVAASSASPPSEALTRFVSAYWQQQLEEAAMSAVLTELPWAHETYQARAWNDPQGERYEALELYSPRCQPPHVGLAILRCGDRASQTQWPTALLSALALQLRDAGKKSDQTP